MGTKRKGFGQLPTPVRAPTRSFPPLGNQPSQAPSSTPRHIIKVRRSIRDDAQKLYAAVAKKPVYKDILDPTKGLLPVGDQHGVALTATGAGSMFSLVTPNRTAIATGMEQAAATLAMRAMNSRNSSDEIHAMDVTADAYGAWAEFHGVVRPGHNQAARADFRAFMAGSTSAAQFNAQHRARSPGQDEQVSTASARHFLQGAKAVRDAEPDPKRRKKLDSTLEPMFAIMSAARTPTADSQFAVQSSTGQMVGVMHPTNSAVPTFPGGNRGHAAADALRANAFVQGLSTALKDTKTAAVPFAFAVGVAQNVSLNSMIGPSGARNIRSVHSTPSRQRKQLQAREGSKQQVAHANFMSNGTSAAAGKTQPLTAAKKIGPDLSPYRLPLPSPQASKLPSITI